MTSRSPESDFEAFAVGVSASLTRTVTAADIDAFAAVTGDDNPLHMDDGYAAGLGMHRRVAHGMLTAGFVSTLIGTQIPGPGALWLSQSMRFRVPVRVGDEIVVTARVTQASASTRVLTLELSAVNQDRRVVLDGTAQVHLLHRLSPMVGGRAASGTAVVTGGSRGIGAAIATRLAADGLPVVLSYRRDEAAANAVARAIVDGGGAAMAVQADAADAHAVRAMIERAEDRFGPVEVLVSNAGGPTRPRALADTSWEDVAAHLDSHLRGAVLAVTTAAPGMIERGFGRIVTITSQAAYGLPPPRQSGYVVAKAALAAYTRCLAAELGPHGITANAVAPGMVDTAMTEDVPQRVKLSVAAATPTRRLTTVDEVAESVSFLAGLGGAFMTGQTLQVSGGQVMG